MKIIITVESYTPLKNGVQEITQAYAEFLSKLHDVTVITRKVEGMPATEVINGVSVLRVNVYTKKSMYLGDITEYRELLVQLSKESDLLINVCTQTALTDCILPVLPLIQCKKILYLHGIAHFTFPNVPNVDAHDLLSWGLNVSRWKGFYRSSLRYFSQYDAVIHLHHRDKSFELFDRLPVKNYVLENFSNYNFSQIERQCGNNRPYIMIANYMHDKNQELGMEAYYSSNTKRRLCLIGSSESKYLIKLKKYEKKLQDKFGKKDVEFIVGENHNETMFRLYNSFALLHSSKSEKYPVVLCEAMKAGVPFICTDTGICRYLPGGVTVKNVQEMTETINNYERNPDERIIQINKGLNYAQSCQNFEKNCEKLMEIIADIM